MEVALGSIDEQKKRSSSCRSPKKRSTDGSFPKKGRQFFVAAKWPPPPLAIFWVRHWMRAGRVEEAGALPARIGQAIQRRCCSQRSRCSGRADVGSIWAAVKRLIGRQAAPVRVEGVTAESLNRHYADISTDPQYTEPARKQSAADATCPQRCVSEWEMFRMLDTLRPTTAGLDGLPAWYLKLAARIFSNHLAYLFNLSIASSSVPSQWKEACITPIPKVSCPQQPSDFRPISITPIPLKTDGTRSRSLFPVSDFP
jgi:hypothetical protein